MSKRRLRKVTFSELARDRLRTVVDVTEITSGSPHLPELMDNYISQNTLGLDGVISLVLPNGASVT